MNKLFNIGTRIEAEWSQVDPNSLVEVMITTDAETKQKIWEIFSNSRLNPNIVQYHIGGGPTSICLRPYRGYEAKGTLITSMAYLAAVMVQIEDFDLLLNDRLELVTTPQVTGFDVDRQTIDELKNFWVGVKAVINLENMIENLGHNGLYIGDLKQWQYEANEAFRRLKFSPEKALESDILFVKTRAVKITETVEDVKRHHKLQGMKLALLQKQLEAFASYAAEFGVTPTMIKMYKEASRDIEVEWGRLEQEAREFSIVFGYAKTALQEIRGRTPPAPPTPIIKK